MEYGGNFFPRQPYKSEGVLAHLFALPSSYGTLQALVDRTLNAASPKGRRYLVAAPWVFTTFMQMERLTSLDSEDCKKGIYRENELNVTVLLLAFDGWIPRFASWLPDRIQQCIRERGWILPRLVAWMPYLWVDAGTVMTAGREVYGFPKQIGFFTMPGASGARAEFGVESDVITRFDPASRVERKPVLQVRRTDAAGVIEGDLFTQTLGDFMRRISGASGINPAARLLLDAMALLPAPELRLLFLKQFRDSASGAASCFRSVFEAGAPITRFGTGELLGGDYEVEIFNHDSAPMGRELFGDSSASVTIRPFLASRFDFDFVINCS